VRRSELGEERVKYGELRQAKVETGWEQRLELRRQEACFNSLAIPTNPRAKL
jgi:hypothetical protein